MPFVKTSEPHILDIASKWLADEKGALIGVLATLNLTNHPTTRAVAIREITHFEPLLFTQKGSEKVKQIELNNKVSLTVLLDNSNKQITFEGRAYPITSNENQSYWDSYPQQSKIRFCVYGPKSGKYIENPAVLNHELFAFEKECQNKTLRMPEAYVGYRIRTKILKLYELLDHEISKSWVAKKTGSNWEVKRVVP
ncbi:MAG: Pyridoxine/pyridoxamine 5'-phosphate oxidase [Chlamydiae bacterium]|nr:Pyridoxine/pyridoxamine 5'-phosphate oxidase [Chlamydiota bacterium]